MLRAPFVEVILKPNEVGMLRLQRKPSTAAKRVGEVVGSGDAVVDGVLTAAVRAALEQTELAQKLRHVGCGTPAPDVAAGAAKAGDEAERDRVAPCHKDDRYGLVAAFAASAGGVP